MSKNSRFLLLRSEVRKTRLRKPPDARRSKRSSAPFTLCPSCRLHSLVASAPPPSAHVELCVERSPGLKNATSRNTGEKWGTRSRQFCARLPAGPPRPHTYCVVGSGDLSQKFPARPQMLPLYWPTQKRPSLVPGVMFVRVTPQPKGPRKVKRPQACWKRPVPRAKYPISFR